jgi:diguanylate cyclase (GGDEF)-like protein
MVPPQSSRPPDQSHVERVQRLRLQILAIAAGSYTLDAVWLACFRQLGILDAWVAPAYLALAAIIVVVFYLFFSRGWNLRLRDQDMAEAQITAAYFLTLGFLVLAPEVGIFFLLNLFVVFAFGALSMTVRRFVLAWFLLSTATGVVLLSQGEAVGLPLATPAERIVVALAFASMLGRTVLLSVRVSDLRGKLYRRSLALRDAKERAEELARVDPLTGTLNRRTFFELAEEETLRTLRHLRPFCIAVLDLDHFKSINDRFGHPVGDRALAAFAATVTSCLRATDKLGRYGGEEFVVLMPETPLDGGRVVVERIRTAVKEADWAAIAPALELTVSIGIAAFRRGETVGQLLERSDFALYLAKREGRDRTVEG